MIKKKEKRSAWYFISYTNNRTGFDRLTGLTKYSLLRWGDGKAGTEVQAKLIQTTEVCTVCGLPTVQLQLKQALQPSSCSNLWPHNNININYPSSRQDRLGAYLHVYPATCGLCRNIYACEHWHTDFLLRGVAYTQAISCTSYVWSWTLLLKSLMRVGRQNALGLE